MSTWRGKSYTKMFYLKVKMQFAITLSDALYLCHLRCHPCTRVAFLIANVFASFERFSPQKTIFR